MKKITVFHSLVWILCSSVLVNAFAYGAIKGYLFWKRSHGINYKVPIRAIVQTGPQKEALKTAYLAELLNLSHDQPTLTSDFDLREANRKLLHSPVIKEGEVKIKEPGILYIDYTIRQPLAFLLDFANVALDQEGYPFPIAPFFTPKKLPEVYLGLEEGIKWNQPITGEKIELAFDLLKMLSGPIVSDLFNIKRIDVSNAFSRGYGKQEIILFTEDLIYTTSKQREICFVFPHILRLPPKKYAQELSNYLKLREQLIEKERQELKVSEDNQTPIYCRPKTIDFRIPQLAFVDEGEIK